MSSEQLQFVFSLFSFIGLIGILVYLILEKTKSDEKLEKMDALEQKIDALQKYIYELDEELEALATSKDNLKEKIIEMHQDGKESMVIENALNVAKAKIEMVIKFHELKEKNEKK